MTSPAAAIEFPTFGSLFGDDETEAVEKPTNPAKQAGSKAWWRKHKKKAVFVPGQGYQVEGFDGFYDGDGRPIDAPVDVVVE